MDAFSSSFLNPTITTLPPLYSTKTPSNSHSTPPQLTVSSVRLEEKPSTYHVTTRETAPPPRPKPSPPPSSSKTKRRIIPQQKRKVGPTVPALIFNAFDDVINNFIDPPVRPSVDPRFFLSDNFAPVDEFPPTECQIVQGSLPPSLNGAYIRNGPNPQYLPRGPYHLFDGDGMLHSVKLSNGKAVYCCRYVKTYKYNVERENGSPILPNFFSGFNGLTASAARVALAAVRVVGGQFNPVNGIGVANTSLAYFGDRLYALGESDLPYTVRLTSNGDIETVGRCDFDRKLIMSMTAHPKVDSDTGEAFGFRYGPMPPFLTYFRFDPDGNKQPDVPVFSMTSPSFLHDFAITKEYAIFTEMQLGMNPAELIFKNGSPVRSDPGKVTRVGIIPRYAKDESDMKWFNVPGFNNVHAINAWDEDDGNSVVMLAPNILAVEHAIERMELVHSVIEKVKIDLRTGIVTRHPLTARNLEFAVINQKYIGKKNKYVYAAAGDPMPKIFGVVKLDVLNEEKRDCTVACRMFGPGCYGGEPFFVPREAVNGEVLEEDDGYLVSYVHDENNGESKFLVMDAKSPELDIIAAVKTPQRVPYGFHGLFVKESDLNKV